MKATDLRIGNLFQYDNKFFKVKEIRKYIIIGDRGRGEVDFSIKDIKPIEITEEWLLKMGFELTYNSEFTKTYEPLKFSVIDAKWNKTYQYYIRHKGERLENIKYVNQLQNLYHAVTGEELTIKPLNNE